MLTSRRPRRTPHNAKETTCLGACFRGQATAPDPDTIDFEDFEHAVGADACTVVDVREPHEFAAGHIPNALNMPMSRFDPQELPDGKPVVLVCQAGGRSRNALNKARAIGREDVKHYAGGTAGWRLAGASSSADPATAMRRSAIPSSPPWRARCAPRCSA